jgi:hypothetical protein
MDQWNVAVMNHQMNVQKLIILMKIVHGGGGSSPCRAVLQVVKVKAVDGQLAVLCSYLNQYSILEEMCIYNNIKKKRLHDRVY